MKRLIAAACLAVLSAPAFAQAPLDDVKVFLSRYVAAFNKGDAATLAKDYYATPGVAAADTQARLETQYAKLRGDEFGKLDLYSFNGCKADAASADVQMDFAFQYTYGGVMPPGDQSTMLKLAKTADGWRIVSGVDFAPGKCS